ncbi:MAG TPA: hypothetical protein VHE61_15495 [Opitutaceae bacterium]|nr:hypothetical protein [Opitutaceae bacterium]
MKTDHYKTMLESVERALQVCRESLDKVDESHRKICDDLQDARDRLRALLLSSASQRA